MNVIDLTNVGRAFPGPPAVHALRDATLTIAAGDYVAIVGPSGSGKSTLLNILGLLDRPTAGRYEFAGQNVSELSENQRCALRAQHIGFVFQSFHLMPRRTAFENVRTALIHNGTPHRKRNELATAALERVGLPHRLHSPTQLLSGGERQRVAIARALVGSPSLVLCDEPTGNLDSINSASVMTLLDDLNAAGATLCVITHDVEVAQQARRTVQINDGLLTEQPINQVTLP